MIPPLRERNLIETMVDAALAASHIIDAIYSAGARVELKPDGSPVTDADRLAEAAILHRLSTTGIPVLAEESASIGQIPVLGSRFFVVDPLDGTKEFIKRNGEFTVNIALIEAGRPVAGVVTAPALGQGWIGHAGKAFRFELSSADQRTPIQAQDIVPRRLVASRSHGHQALIEFMQALHIDENISVGSSLKFCLLAEGNAEVYPRFTPTAEWDTAAGQAVLEAAGGCVLTNSGSALGYGKSESGYLNPHFIAAASRQVALRGVLEMGRLVI